MGNWFGCRSRRRNPTAGLAAEDIIERRTDGYWHRVGRVTQCLNSIERFIPIYSIG